MNDQRSLMIECACFTAARRHHQVFGKIGSTVLPFQVTAPAMLSFAVVAGLALFGWTLWAWILPTPFDVMLAVIAPIVVAVVAQTTKIEGRDPFKAGIAIARYGVRPRNGVVAGRCEPRRRRGTWSARSMRAQS